MTYGLSGSAARALACLSLEERDEIQEVSEYIKHMISKLQYRNVCKCKCNVNFRLLYRIEDHLCSLYNSYNDLRS